MQHLGPFPGSCVAAESSVEQAAVPALPVGLHTGSGLAPGPGVPPEPQHSSRTGTARQSSCLKPWLRGELKPSPPCLELVPPDPSHGATPLGTWVLLCSPRPGCGASVGPSPTTRWVTPASKHTSAGQKRAGLGLSRPCVPPLPTVHIHQVRPQARQPSAVLGCAEGQVKRS